MIQAEYTANYLFSLVYAITAWAALFIVFAIPSAGKVDDRQPTLRKLCTLGIAAFAFGTGLDNARVFAGARAVTWPPGIWESQNDTIANALVDEGHTQLAYPPMLALTNVSFVLHEIFGAFFIVPGLYLWAVSRRVKKPNAELRTCESMTPHCGCCDRVAVWLEPHVSVVSCVLTVAFMLLGAVGYIVFTLDHGFALRYNESLGGWSLTGDGDNPLGLIGVFTSSFTWIFTGVWLARSHQNYWFLIVQLVCFFGQAASVGLGDYMFLVSNFLEQVTLYSLIIVSEWLRRLEIMNQSHSKINGGNDVELEASQRASPAPTNEPQ